MWNTGDADVENDPKVRLYLRSSAMDQSSADQEPELTPEEITKHLTNHFGENVARAFEGQYLRTVQSRTNYNKKGLYWQHQHSRLELGFMPNLTLK